MDDRCGEVEELEKTDQQIMYSKFDELIGKKKPNKNISIKKADGSIAMDIEDFKARRNEYVAEHYHDERSVITEIEIYNLDGPKITREQVRAAIDDMKAGKAVG